MVLVSFLKVLKWLISCRHTTISHKYMSPYCKLWWDLWRVKSYEPRALSLCISSKIACPVICARMSFLSLTFSLLVSKTWSFRLWSMYLWCHSWRCHGAGVLLVGLLQEIFIFVIYAEQKYGYDIYCPEIVLIITFIITFQVWIKRHCVDDAGSLDNW